MQNPALWQTLESGASAAARAPGGAASARRSGVVRGDGAGHGRATASPPRARTGAMPGVGAWPARGLAGCDGVGCERRARMAVPAGCDPFDDGAEETVPLALAVAEPVGAAGGGAVCVVVRPAPAAPPMWAVAA